MSELQLRNVTSSFGDQGLSESQALESGIQEGVITVAASPCRGVPVLGSARDSRGGDGALAITNFSP